MNNYDSQSDIPDSTNSKPYELNTPISGELTSPITASRQLVDALGKGKSHKYIRFVMAAIGVVPWIGAVISLTSELEQENLNDLLRVYVQEQEPKYRALEKTILDIIERLEGLGDDVQDRIQSPEYLALVRRAFRSWDNADTEEKREYIKRLIINAGSTTLCPDDLLRLFISWIDNYHESHFAVIKEIFKNPGITRANIWDNIHNTRPKEDSSEAVLFRYLIRDLSLGGVIVQDKEKDSDGRTMRMQSTTRRPKGSRSQLTESTYEDTKPYVLTELGKEFIHYVLSDAVTRIEEHYDPLMT